MDVQTTFELFAARVPNLFWIPFLFFLIPVAFIVAIRLLAARRERNRTAQLERLASQLGFDFLPKGDADFFTELEAQGLSLFVRRRRRKLVNLLRSQSQNVLVAIFDYSYIVQSGEHSSLSRQTVVAFQSAVLAMQPFLLTPKNFFHKIGALFSSNSIEFQGHPQFDKTYMLRGDDVEGIRQMFTEPVLEFFEQNPGWQTEASGQYMLLFKPGKRTPPPEIPGLLESGLTLLSRFRSAR